MLEPLDFIARLVAMVPKPRAYLTRYHGVFAPKSAAGAARTAAKRLARPVAIGAVAVLHR